MKKILWIWIFVVLSTQVAHAVKVTGLYQAEVAVTAKSREARADATREGFQQVLRKLSGNVAIDRNPQIRAAIQRAEYFVSDFNYLSETRDSAEYTLQINYEPRDVNRLLRQTNIPFWGDERPLVLVWLVVTNAQHGREIIGNEAAGDVYQRMIRESRKYGLPLIFPMMDMDEIEKVSPDDVANLSIKVLEKTAKRYAPEALLIGDLTEDEQGAQSKWQLMMDDMQWNWKFNDKSADAVVAAIITQVSQTLASESLAKTAKVVKVLKAGRNGKS